ncbi:NEDD8 protease nep2 [Homalodisca vitripennis]|nr:NEDD8 protease nep2 [Homalodisca vitripennis]KAG8324188.1 NEDD8 protease nep2 [Homalodisca vitripennis]
MDPSVRPCDDFYKFACGKFLESAELRDYLSSNFSFIQVNEIVEDQLKAILFEESTPDEPNPYKTMKHLFSLCLDEDKIDARGVSPAVSRLEAAGGWPVLGNWRHFGWSFLDTEIRLRNLSIGGGSLFQIDVSVDLKNASKRVIQIDQAVLGLSREFLVKGLSNPIVQAYYSYMVDIAEMYGADRRLAQVKLNESLMFEIELAKSPLKPSPMIVIDITEMYGADRRLAQLKLNESLMFEIELAKSPLKPSPMIIIDIAEMYGAVRRLAQVKLNESLMFEIELAKITRPQEQRRELERMYNSYDLEDLITEFKWVDWAALLESIMPASVQLRKNEQILVKEVEFLKKLEVFLLKYSDEGKTIKVTKMKKLRYLYFLKGIFDLYNKAVWKQGKNDDSTFKLNRKFFKKGEERMTVHIQLGKNDHSLCAAENTALFVVVWVRLCSYDEVMSILLIVTGAKEDSKVSSNLTKNRKNTGRISDASKRIRNQSLVTGIPCNFKRFQFFTVISEAERKQIITDLNLMPTFDDQNAHLSGLISVHEVEA